MSHRYRSFDKPTRTASLLLPLILVLNAGCEQQEPQAAQTHASAMPPQQVTAIELQPADLPAQFEYIGRLEASRDVEIRPRVTGLIEQRHFEEGGRVAAGDLLFVIDRAPFIARRQAAQATLAEARARLLQTEREVRRVTPLSKANAISQRDYDDALSNRDLAKAAQAAAEAALSQAQLDLDYTEVVAPISGRIGAALEVEGALVSPTSGPLARLGQVDPIYVEFSISENQRLALDKQLADGTLTMPAPDQTPVNITLADGSTYALGGQMDFTDYRVDPATGAYALRATIPNPDGRLSPGQFVRVQMRGGVLRQALAVPQRAVQEDANGKFVYLVTSSEKGGFVASPKPVVVGRWVETEGGGHTERQWVIREGLAAGDKVVVEGMARILFPGMAIDPQPPASDAEGTAKGPAEQKATSAGEH